MHVLLINGSPHEAGCTFTALEEIAGQLKKHGVSSEIFQIGTEPIRGCLGCGGCWDPARDGHCVFDDAVVNPLIDKLRAADGVVAGSPVYYAGAAGQLCCALDRVFFASGSRFAGKPAAGVFSCRRGGIETAFDRINKYFTICEMPVVASRYWNGVHGFTPDDVRKDVEGLQVMRALADNMAWMLQNLAGKPRPPQEPKVSYNFVRED